MLPKVRSLTQRPALINVDGLPALSHCWIIPFLSDEIH